MIINEKWSKEKIQKVSKSLIGKTVGEVLTTQHLDENKGRIGQAVETDIFHMKNNSRKLCDFVDAGIELKVIPLKRTSKKLLVPKERMVLTMINFMEDYKFSFEESHLLKKAGLMQVIQYEHDFKNLKNSKFINQFLLKFPGEDREIIKSDYCKIMDRIKSGEAHLISERDTNYLSACRKGSGKQNDFRQQPFSDKKAPSRAFSLKPSYLKVINNRNDKTKYNLFADFTQLKRNNFSFEQTLENTVKPFINMTKEQLITKFGLNEKENSKQIFNLIVSKIFDFKKNISHSNELKKAGIKPKTMRIINGRLKESVSFPQIKPNNLLQTEWEDSILYETFKYEKFCFFIFEGEDSEKLKFKGMKIWEMPNKDIIEYSKVYDKMRAAIQIKGSVWKETTYKNKFPKESESEIGHVRPKARNSKDTYLLPSGDVTPKQCFWLNKKYIMKVLKNKGD